MTALLTARILAFLVPSLVGVLFAMAWYSLGGRELAAYLSSRRQCPVTTAESQAAGIAHLIAIAEQQAAATDTVPMPAIPEPLPAEPERRIAWSSV